MLLGIGMSSLHTMDLSSNYFDGLLPKEWATVPYFPKLQYLSLAGNPLLKGAVQYPGSEQYCAVMHTVSCMCEEELRGAGQADKPVERSCHDDGAAWLVVGPPGLLEVRRLLACCSLQ